MLTQYSESWRYGFVVCIHYEYNFYRFAYAHLYNKCRREVLLEYFGEELEEQLTCDVCENLNDTSDYTPEIKVILQSTRELSEVGEKKVFSLFV